MECAIFKCLLFSVNAHEYLFKMTNYYLEVIADFLVILVLFMIIKNMCVCVRYSKRFFFKRFKYVM